MSEIGQKYVKMWIVIKKYTSIVYTSTLYRFTMYVYDRYDRGDAFIEFKCRLEATDMDEEFTEFVRLSKNWKDLALHCGYELKCGTQSNKWRSALQKKVISLGLDTQHFNCRPRMDQMYQISVKDFKEHVRLSHSWSELARRCGQRTKFGRFCSHGVVSTLKEKVLFLNLDTEHFGKCARTGESGETDSVVEVGESGEMGEKVVQMGENGREILKAKGRAEIARLPLAPPPFDLATGLQVVKQMEMAARQNVVDVWDSGKF